MSLADSIDALTAAVVGGFLMAGAWLEFHAHHLSKKI
jgi:hypothetical protein